MRSSINENPFSRDSEMETEQDIKEKTRKEFADVEQDFTNVYKMNGKVASRMNLDIEVCTTSHLSESSLKSIKKTIFKTLKTFESEFGSLPQSNETRKFSVYLFDDKQALSTALDEIGIPGGSSGVAWPSVGKIYVAQMGKNKVENLSHEVTHQLEYYATGGAYQHNKAARYLAEGISDYVQYVVEHAKKVNLDFMHKAEVVLKMLNDDEELSSAESISALAAIVEERKSQQQRMDAFNSEVEKEDVRSAEEVLEKVNKHKIELSDSDYVQLQNAKDVREAVDVVRKYVDSTGYSDLTYSMNRAIVKYLQDTKPGLIQEMFAEAFKASEKFHYTEEMEDLKLPASVDHISNAFTEWLEKHTVLQFTQHHELPVVTAVEKIGYRNVVIDGKVRQSEVFTTKLEDKDQKEIMVLSPVEHVAMDGVIRAANPHTDDIMRVDEKYNHMKLVNTSEGAKFVYCDADGQEYYASSDGGAVKSIASILAKYDTDFAYLREVVDKIHWSYLEYRQMEGEYYEHNLSENMHDAYYLLQEAMVRSNVKYDALSGIEVFVNTSLDGEECSRVVDTINTLRDAYDAYVLGTAQSLMTDDSSVDIKEHEMLGKIFKSLAYIDPRTIISAKKVNFSKVIASHPNEIINLEITGRGDKSAISAFLDGKKIGELPHNVGVFTEYKDDAGSAVRKFVVSDVLRDMHTVYSSTPLVVITYDERGKKVVNLVSGIEVDNVDSEAAQVEVNKFLDLLSKGALASESFPISKGVSIASHGDIKNSQLDPAKAYALRGQKVEDRGTEEESDDRYEAVVKMGDKVLVEKLASMEFRISEGIQDLHGNVIDAPDFLMMDVLSDKRFQFPSSITHLKLIRTEEGNVRLIPCTKDGVVDPEGMPANVGQYSYIDPIFAYARIDVDSASRHAKFDLIDFSKYETGKMFKLSPDTNDPKVPKDENGNVVRAGESNLHTTRVTITDEASGEKIGELASAPTFFQGEVFISFDRSYSSSDFLSSLYRQEVDVKDVGEGVKRVSLSGEGDLGTDRGYSNYYSFCQKEKKDSASTVQDDLKTHHEGQVANSIRTEVKDDTETSFPNIEVTGGHVKGNSKPSGREITDSESEKLGDISTFMRVTKYATIDGSEVPVYSFNIFQRDGKYFQFPEEITHMKVVTYNETKYLVPCTAEGNENPDGMPEDMGDSRYIDPILVHKDVLSERIETGAQKLNLFLLNLDAYEDGTLLEMRHVGEKSYSALNISWASEGEISTVHLFDGDNEEVGTLSRYTSVNYGKSEVFSESGSAVDDSSEFTHTAQSAQDSESTYEADYEKAHSLSDSTADRGHELPEDVANSHIMHEVEKGLGDTQYSEDSDLYYSLYETLGWFI